jgi:hypothetical protein
MLVAAGGKCNWKGVRTVRNWKQVSHQEKGFYQTVVDAYFEAKANRRKEPTPDVDAIAAQIRRTLNVPARVAAALASIAFPKKAEMRKWFEDGRLPCSLQLLWEPVLASLDELSTLVRDKKEELEKVQQKKENSHQQTQEFRHQLATSEEAEKSFEKREKILMAQLEDLQRLDVANWVPFVQSAAEVEKELVSQLETQLVEDRESLFALNEEGSPKLSLLLNAFGADERTIQTLADLRSMDLIPLRDEELKEKMVKLLRYQQTVVLYTQERLVHGMAPFARHDCALCDCETAEEMTYFLNEIGFEKVTADLIRGTGASGKGALLFLSPQDLQLGNRAVDQRALMQARSSHRKK